LRKPIVFSIRKPYGFLISRYVRRQDLRLQWGVDKKIKLLEKDRIKANNGLHSKAGFARAKRLQFTAVNLHRA